MINGDMDSQSGVDDPVGDAAVNLSRLIRELRKNAGLSQKDLAIRIGYTREYVAQAERRDLRVPSASLIQGIDRALEAEGALIAAHEKAARLRLQRRRSQTVPIVNADDHPMIESGLEVSDRSTPVGRTMYWYGGIRDAVVKPLENIRGWNEDNVDSGLPSVSAVVRDTARASLGSDYTRVGETLPGLIARAEYQVFTNETTSARRSLSDAYELAAWSLIKADQFAPAWVAANRSIAAARGAGDALRAASATRCMAEVQMRNGDYQDATRTALMATVDLAGAGSDSACNDRRAMDSIRGAALLTAATASARLGMREEAYDLLAAADRSARQINEEVVTCSVVFGSANVAIHRTVVAVELGDDGTALDAAKLVDLTKLPKECGERRSRFLIDVARANLELRNIRAAYEALICAESISPSEVRNHRVTRKMLPLLLRCGRSISGVRELAERCGME